VSRKQGGKYGKTWRNQQKEQTTQSMNYIWNSLKCFAFIALAVCAVSCTSLKNEENLAAASGFKIITPVTSGQEALLKKLPPDQVTRINYQGKTYFVLPDVKNNQAYVGDEAQYDQYQKLRLQQQLSNDNLEAAQMNEAASENWGGWGGWYGVP
jgi:hypothetical protein